MLQSIKQASKYQFYFASFLVISFFFIAFFPANRTEVDDGYWYAESIRDRPFREIFNTRFLLFLPFVKLAYNYFFSWGFHIDAYYFLCGVSICFASATLILLYDTLLKYLRLDAVTSILIVVMLAFSYEFWRYAVESEVYLLATFLVLANFRFLLRWSRKQSLSNLCLVWLSGSFATLFYKPDFIPVYLVFPVIMLYHKNLLHLTLYYLLSAVTIVGVFWCVYDNLSLNVPFVPFLFGGANEPVGSAIKAVFVLISNFLSILWLFGSKHITSFIAENFPHKVIAEEKFMGIQVNDLLYILPFVFLLIMLTGAFMVYNAFRRRILARDWSLPLLILLLWAIIYGAFLMVMDPTSNEPWLMIQIPLVVIFGVLFFKPLEGSQRWIAVVFVLLMFANNFYGGVNLLRDAKYDYNYQKAKWLVANATADDYIITYGPMSFVRYLRYKTPSTVLNFEENPALVFKLLNDTAGVKGSIYFPDDIFNPPPAIFYRTPIDLEKVKALYESHNYGSCQVYGSGKTLFKTYKLVEVEK